MNYCINTVISVQYRVCSFRQVCSNTRSVNQYSSKKSTVKILKQYVEVLYILRNIIYTS